MAQTTSVLWSLELSDETSVHLTVWFKADLANSLYRFYLVEEART